MRFLPKGHSHPYFFKCRGGGFFFISPFDVQMCPPHRGAHIPASISRFCPLLAHLWCGSGSAMALTHTLVLPLLQSQQCQHQNQAGGREQGLYSLWIQCEGNVVKGIQGEVMAECLLVCLSEWQTLKRPVDIRKVVEHFLLWISACNFAKFSSLVL